MQNRAKPEQEKVLKKNKFKNHDLRKWMSQRPLRRDQEKPCPESPKTGHDKNKNSKIFVLRRTRDRKDRMIIILLLDNCLQL